jgi:hypothetical protein
MWKDAVISYLKLYAEGLKKTTDTVSKDSQVS